MFNKCYNDSIVKGRFAGGGIVGSIFISNLRIWNCGVSSNSQIIGNNCAGGILGQHMNYGTNYIYNSYVLGKISGTKYVGGIAGDAYSRSNESGARIKIENSYFAGTIKGETNVGGIIGASRCDDIEKMSFSNCYYISTVERGISNVEKDGITALSQEDMKENDTLITYLKSYTNTEQELSVWNKLPNEYPTNINL